MNLKCFGQVLFHLLLMNKESKSHCSMLYKYGILFKML